MDLNIVKTTDIPFVWSALLPFVERITDESHGESNVAEYLANLSTGNYLCWTIMDGKELRAICITRVDIFHAHKALHIMGVSGAQWPLWKDHHKVLETHAKELGCDRITMWGRAGWKRMMDSHGFSGANGESYKETSRIMQMELKDE